ncbi:catalase family protein [Pseudomaricurvus alcaniphilus]|uniref:catalase family protein n=1 Tax=Pseudomaricurvus alcaniphilus TaxID=1166482 RepID=UPI00140E3C37|nr:catalase family protein [Pseudomaricurvus alcaniphilus]NHN37673.1 catalase family protein [Pseudomaricurvus alcaniphilus]
MLLQKLHAILVRTLEVERRLEPFFRPQLNYLLRQPAAALLQYLINFGRPYEFVELAEETIFSWEEESNDAIIKLMAEQMRGHFTPGKFERGGNTKTHGLVRATVTIRDDVPERMRKGIFATPRSYPAYIRFSGPGPDVPRDIQDVGFSSMAIKVMDVPGPKLMDDEKYTQDFIGVCTPTFVTPNTRENAKLQDWSLRDMPIYYFLNPKDSHLRDFLMQGLWNETQYNPLGHRYYSCVPYLLGEGQAVLYSFASKTRVDRRIPGVPFGRVPGNYLRDNMIKTLAKKSVDFDLQLQLQTDTHRMPIENAAVLWPEKLSPFITVADIHIPKQKFDSPAQFAFTRELTMNPWHCLPEHRPLGNQSRARQRMYYELSRYRQKMNNTQHVEPTGEEVFE